MRAWKRRTAVTDTADGNTGDRSTAPPRASGPGDAPSASTDTTAVRRDGEGRRTTGLAERWTDRWAEVAFEDRMATVEFRVGERAHITVDSDVCRSCTTRACVTACPADLFAPTSDGGILFNYEQCFECGTCYQVCDKDGAITWTYPDGGQGVVFRHG